MRIFFIILLVILAGYVIHLFYKMLKQASRKTPNDALYTLHWKIECALINEVNELTIIKMIKELRLNPEVNQDRLNELDIIFRQRFQELHEIDEHSPEALEYEETMRRVVRERKWREAETN